MTRTVETREAVNAYVAKVRTQDLDKRTTSTGRGSVPAAVQSTVVATEYGDDIWHKTVLTLTACPISISDDAGVAQYGGVQVYDFPAGLISLNAAMISGNLTLGTTGTIIDAFTGVNALGSATAGTGATLTSTEATWLASTANATASSKVAAIDSVSAAAVVPQDGTATAKDMFLNFAIADDASHTAGTGSFTGTIEFVWCLIGDN